jgi:hypothetical protein
VGGTCGHRSAAGRSDLDRVVTRDVAPIIKGQMAGTAATAVVPAVSVLNTFLALKDCGTPVETSGRIVRRRAADVFPMQSTSCSQLCTEFSTAVHNFLSRVGLISRIAVRAVPTTVELHVCKLSPLCITSVDKSRRNTKPAVEHMIERVSPPKAGAVDNSYGETAGSHPETPGGRLERLEGRNCSVTAGTDPVQRSVPPPWSYPQCAAVPPGAARVVAGDDWKSI